MGGWGLYGTLKTKQTTSSQKEVYNIIRWERAKLEYKLVSLLTASYTVTEENIQIKKRKNLIPDKVASMMSFGVTA